MIDQSDIEGRLRLFRYGLVVLVVITFLVSLLTPFAYVNNTTFTDTEGKSVEIQAVKLADFLDEAAIYTLVVAVLAVFVYLVYAWWLRGAVEGDETGGAESAA